MIALMILIFFLLQGFILLCSRRQRRRLTGDLRPGTAGIHTGVEREECKEKRRAFCVNASPFSFTLIQLFLLHQK